MVTVVDVPEELSALPELTEPELVLPPELLLPDWDDCELELVTSTVLVVVMVILLLFLQMTMLVEPGPVLERWISGQGTP